MKHLPAFALALAACCNAHADCPTTLPLRGMVDIPHCDSATGNCTPADEALYAYTRAKPDNRPDVLSIATHGSPWHLYDGDYRILEIEEVAAMVRQQGGSIKRVELNASWSGAAPDRHSPSVAQKLSAALGGMPVGGRDGFLWVSPTGDRRTTQQAFTARLTGPYRVGKDDDLMVSLVPGWAIDLEPEFVRTRDGAGLLRVAAAKEIFMLCPEGALASYEQAAALGNPVAAFNAAILRLERGKPGDAAAARALLKGAAAHGDAKAEKKLKSFARSAPAG